MMQRVSEILKDMKGKASAMAAVLTSSDGLVLGAVQDEGIEVESMAAYAASNMMASERMGESANCGMPESVIIIYQDKAVVMAPVGPVVAILLASSAQQLGNLRLQMKRAMVDLSAALQDELELRVVSRQPSIAQPKEVNAGEPTLEEVAAPLPQAKPVPKVAQRVEPPSVDRELNGNGHRTVLSARRTSVNLK
jgi:predicted regulator of Ras-like GTPase activity (Roadblock/LC7/MglB family)